MTDWQQVTRIWTKPPKDRLPTELDLPWFMYRGTPAYGTLIVSSSETAGTDMFGNDYPAGCRAAP